MYEEELEKDQENIKVSPIKKFLGRFGKGVYDTVEMVVISLAVVVFVYLFILSPHEVVGRSMEDNFWNGEYLLADKVSYRFGEPKRGDVVIFQHSETADYIKRVIGLPGDSVELRDGFYYVNGEKLDEQEYLDDGIYTDGGNYLSEGEVKTVPEGKYFVSGDNRPHSSDSRAFGVIEKSAIKGRAILVYWPVSHLHTVKRPSYNVN